MPTDWTIRRTPTSVVGRNGSALVSATRFALLKPYEPAQFGSAARELDQVVLRLASESGARVSERTTTTVADRKIRAYRFANDSTETRIGFVLTGTREVQLLCRAPADENDPDGACALLFESFSVR